MHLFFCPPSLAAPLALTALLLAATVTPCDGASRSSSGYSVLADSLTAGGAPSSSAAYSNSGSMGLPAGTQTSTGYRNGGGFLPAITLPGFLCFASSVFAGAEGRGVTSATITVQRVSGTDGSVSVSFATAGGGTATAGADYTSTSGTLTWGDADSADKTFVVPILPDTLAEGDETVLLTLSGPTAGAALTTPSLATLTIADRPFDAWRFQHFGAAAQTAAGAPAGDFDGDGVSNLLEYALGLDPVTPGLNATSLSAENGWLTLSVPRVGLATEVTLTAEVSADLLTWSAGPAFTTVLTDTPTLFKVRDNTPLPSPGQRFIRLRASRP